MRVITGIRSKTEAYESRDRLLEFLGWTNARHAGVQKRVDGTYAIYLYSAEVVARWEDGDRKARGNKETDQIILDQATMEPLPVLEQYEQFNEGESLLDSYSCTELGYF